jgi:4'-phosphopantetheinyl transferase
MSAKKIYWLSQKISNLPENDEWLTTAELDQLSNFKIQKRRTDWKLGRWAAKTAVLEYLKNTSHTKHYHEIELRSAADGAPETYIKNRIASFTISLSHSSGIALCAIDTDGLSIGCDIEKVEQRSGAFIQDYFTKKEKDWILSGSGGEKIIFSNLIWSAKESTLKALREGLRLDTRLVEMQLEDRELENDWKPFLAKYFRENLTFYGRWKLTGEFVMTIVSEADLFDLVNLRDI